MMIFHCSHQTFSFLLATIIVVGLGTISTAGEMNVLADLAEQQQWERLAESIDDHPVNDVQVDRMSALHWAVYHKHVPTVKKLIEHSADVNAVSRYAVTPLSLSCQTGHAEIVELLLKAGADANFVASGGVTPLMIASRVGHPAVIEVLLKHEAEIDARERQGQTALMWASAAGNVQAVDLLIKHGADINAASKSTFTAMMFAARNGKLDVVQRLVAAGVDVNHAMQPKSSGGRNPRRGTSALLLAVESGHYELAMWLVEHGADPNDQRSGYAPLHSLTWTRKPKRGEDPDGDPPPRGSGNLTDLQFVRAIVHAGADVNLRLKNGSGGRAHLNHKGATPFLLAARTADMPYLKVLMELGADPDIPNSEGCTPLMACAGVGVRAVGEEAGTEPEVLETLAFLIEHGADVNAVDENKETAMHGAAYRNFPKVVDFLAEQGADPEKWNHKNKPGWTPVMIAQGHRPGSFKPSPVTVAALKRAMNRKSVADSSQ